MDAKLLTIPEVAKRLRVSVSAVYKWTRPGATGTGRIPRLRVTKIGSRSLIAESELNRLIESNTR